MKEYIEREAAIKTINKLRIGLRTQGAYEFDLVAAEAKHRIESIPAADVREEIHGRWEKQFNFETGKEDLCICSNCRMRIIDAEEKNDFNFCPLCGANMRLTEEENVNA